MRRLADASFCYSVLRGWEESGRLDAMLDIMRRTWRNRAYGDFYGYMLVAEGAVDIMVEPELSLWDLAALVPIVTEAGGTSPTWTGGPARRRQRGGDQRQAAHDLLDRLTAPGIGPREVLGSTGERRSRRSLSSPGGVERLVSSWRR